MYKDLIAIGTIGFSSAMTFVQITPESVGGWEKIGVVGILIAAVGFLVVEKRGVMKELTTEVSKLTAEIKKLKISLRRFQKRKGIDTARKESEPRNGPGTIVPG